MTLSTAILETTGLWEIKSKKKLTLEQFFFSEQGKKEIPKLFENSFSIGQTNIFFIWNRIKPRKRFIREWAVSKDCAKLGLLISPWFFLVCNYFNVYLMQWLDFFQVEDAHQNANRTYHGHVYKGWQSKYWNHSLSFRPNDAKGRAIRAPNWDSFSNQDQKMCNRKDHTRPPTVFRTSTLHQFWSKNNLHFSHKKWQNNKYRAK